VPRPRSDEPRSDAYVGIRLPRDLRERARAAARADGRPLANLIKHLLIRFIAEQEALHGQPRHRTGIGYWDPPEPSTDPACDGAGAKATTVSAADGAQR
jgi:hypothetical protein